MKEIFIGAKFHSTKEEEFFFLKLNVFNAKSCLEIGIGVQSLISKDSFLMEVKLFIDVRYRAALGTYVVVCDNCRRH